MDGIVSRIIVPHKPGCRAMKEATVETQSKEWPITFTAWSLDRILDRGKWQTRRIVSWTNSTVLGYPAKPYWPNLLFDHAGPRDKASIMVAIAGDAAPDDLHLSVPFRHPDDPPCSVEELARYRVRPKWEAGDRFWVRESCRYEQHGGRYGVRLRKGNLFTPAPPEHAAHVAGKIGRPNGWGKWHVRTPRWASRLTLEITGVRAERVQEISEADAGAEGIASYGGGEWTHNGGLTLRRTAVEAYRDLWGSIHGKGSWEQNPWVWVAEFKVVEPE